MSNRLGNLIQELYTQKQVCIMTHDFPDHDAIAAAFGLQYLLQSVGLEAQIVYRGMLQSPSLEHAINLLQISVYHFDDVVQQDAQIIAIDGLPNLLSEHEKKITAIIDHHNLLHPSGIRYKDVRTSYGACATIIWEYFRESSLEIPRSVATALLMGIMMDTMFMTRGVSQADLRAHSELFYLGDWELASRLLRNSLSIENLSIFREAMQQFRRHKHFVFIPLSLKCSVEVQALIADFFLGLREITVVAVSIRHSGSIRISVRSEDKSFPGDQLIRHVVQGIGQGGGHAHMAGGQIPESAYPGDAEIEKRFRKGIFL